MSSGSSGGHGRRAASNQSGAALAALGALALVMCMTLTACDREQRRLRESPPSTTPGAVRVSELQPGTVADTASHVANPYENNAYAISEGQRLFGWYNCSGCHANGGGAIGPALMDDEWIYGFEPYNIFSAIVEGRPDGMPSFRNKIPDYQVWQLVAYIQSMSGQTPIDAAPGRSDHMQAHPPEIIQPYRGRVQTGHK